MASWIDVFSLVTTTLFFVGSILGVVYIAHAISLRCQSAKALLENKGITISRDGVSLKSQKRFDRDDYLDATQRGLVKALGTATVGSESHKHALLPRSSPSSDPRDACADGHERHVFGITLRRSRSGNEEGH